VPGLKRSKESLTMFGATVYKYARVHCAAACPSISAGRSRNTRTPPAVAETGAMLSQFRTRVGPLGAMTRTCGWRSEAGRLCLGCKATGEGNEKAAWNEACFYKPRMCGTRTTSSGPRTGVCLTELLGTVTCIIITEQAHDL
jgi:hypothetical protein